jgi:hypothetical protein
LSVAYGFKAEQLQSEKFVLSIVCRLWIEKQIIIEGDAIIDWKKTKKKY